MCLIAIHIFFLVKCLFKSFAHFLSWAGCLPVGSHQNPGEVYPTMEHMDYRHSCLFCGMCSDSFQNTPNIAVKLDKAEVRSSATFGSWRNWTTRDYPSGQDCQTRWSLHNLPWVVKFWSQEANAMCKVLLQQLAEPRFQSLPCWPDWSLYGPVVKLSFWLRHSEANDLAKPNL